ncbi:lytic transglycosylase catalytic [Photorhabdus heterorhabditis]|uniref:lytic transglycosylase catalytic n=1 Tax=Photorhabdus heterorhabditis TaxID=880156 RepID=UPI00156238FB|nr:lytic transglycosylase catalytic [Photorhabdus heterorhabditis]NRN30596.1 lytic transglycosylase catalytic [Photorhabdus heterorhabditis subsp. aluminescens]
MSDNVNIIKDFLISLGFDVDEKGRGKFDAVLKGVTANVLKVGAAVEGAALTIVGFTTKIAEGLDKLYWQSQRTGATVAGIKALGYAVAQMGGSAEAAQGALENMARFMRNNPGAEGWLNRLGVQTRDSSGQMRDAASILAGVGQKLSNMPYYRANQYAQMLGIDENTLMAMRRGLAGFTADYQRMLQKTGFNADKAAQQANKFTTALRGFNALLGILRDKIGANLANGLASSFDSLRQKILDNFPKIEATLTKIIKGILWFAEVFSRMVYRVVQGIGDVIDWWKRLDESSKMLIAMFGAIVVAWRLLNSAFLMSPIGAITVLSGALLLLYDDYKTWKEGGKSLIDWSKWEKDIDRAVEAFKTIGKWIKKGVDGVGGWKNAFLILGGVVATTWAVKMLAGFARVSAALTPLLARLAPLLGLVAYGGYLYSDWDNIKQSAASSWDYNTRQIKRGIGDVGAWLGIDNDWANKHQGGLPNPITSDIPGMPGAPTPPPSPEYSERGLRNNNPGNLNFVGQRGAALENPGGRFARFETAFDGLRALSRQLTLYASRGLTTIRDIITKYAPPEENDTEDYIAFLTKWLSVDPDAQLNLQDPNTLTAMMSGIIQRENGRNPYNSELINKAAIAGSGNVQQTTNITVHGATDAKATANEIASRQNGVNARLIQQVS